MSDFINVANEVAKATLADPTSAALAAGKSLLADGIVYESDGVNWDPVTTGDFTAATLPDPATLAAGTTVVVDVRNSGASDALVSDGERYSSVATGSKSVGRFIKNATATNTVKLRTAFRKSIGGFTGNDSYFCFPGDSTTVGIGANGVADGTANCREYSFVTKLSQILAAKFAAKTANGNMFTGHNIAYNTYATYNPRAVLTNVTINNSYTGGANSVFTNSGGTGATIVYTPGVAFTSITVYYIQGPGLGSFTTQIDGGASLGTVSTAGAKAIKSVTYTGLSGTASSTVTLTFVGAANLVFIEGFTVGTGVSAINMINFGAGGLKVSDFNNVVDEWRAGYIPAALLPSVAFIQLGINDCKDNAVDPPTYATNLTTMITTWKAAGVEVYIVGKLPSNPAYNAYTNVTRQNAFVDAAYSAAVANSVPFIDLYGYMDSYAYQSGMGMMTDGLHGNAGLYADEALFMANCIEHIASKI